MYVCMYVLYVCMYVCFRIVLDDKFINNRVQVDENFSIANIAAKITVSLYIHEQLFKIHPIIKSYVCMYVCMYVYTRRSTVMR